MLLITVGVFVASIGDLEFDRHAYLMGSLSVLAQGSYLTLVQRRSERDQRSTIEMINVNAFNTLPFFFAMMFFSGEIYDVVKAPVLTGMRLGFIHAAH